MSSADHNARSRLLPGGTAAPAAEPDEVAEDPGTSPRRDATAEPGSESVPSADRRIGAPDLRASLVRAMRAAAEESRAGLIDAVRAEAARAADAVRAQSEHVVTQLRRAADEDAAAIRAAAEDRLRARATALEEALQGYESRVAADTAQIRRAVAAFEAETDAFFARLATIEDPAEFAAAAAAAPPPPSFAGAAVPDRGGVRDLAVEVDGPAWPVHDLEPPASVDAPTAEPVAPDAEMPHAVEPTPAVEPAPRIEPTGGVEPADPRVIALDWTHVFVRATGSAADDRPEDADSTLPDVADRGAEVSEEHLPDRRADVARTAAPADLAASAGATASVAEPTETTRVVVSGLVNVASIASFKRHLARVRGVVSVLVSSGPDGEFVFTTHHVPNVSLRDVVPALPGFAARVTSNAGGTLTVSARDPESDS